MFDTTNVQIMQMLNYCVAGKDGYRDLDLKGIIFSDANLVATNSYHIIVAKMDYPEFLEGMLVTLPKITGSVKRIIIEDGESLNITYMDKKGAGKTILEKKRESSITGSAFDKIINRDETPVKDNTISYNWSYLAGLQKAMGYKEGFAVTLYQDSLIAEGNIGDVDWKYKLMGLKR